MRSESASLVEREKNNWVKTWKPYSSFFWKELLTYCSIWGKRHFKIKTVHSIFKNVHLSVSRSVFLKSGFTPCVKDHVESGNFIRDRMELRNQFQRLFASDKFGQHKKMRNIFVLIAGGVKWVPSSW